MSRRVLADLLGLKRNEKLHEITNLPMDKPSLVLAVCKQYWAENLTELACNTLEQLTNKFEAQKVSKILTSIDY